MCFKKKEKKNVVSAFGMKSFLISVLRREIWLFLPKQQRIWWVETALDTNDTTAIDEFGDLSLDPMLIKHACLTRKLYLLQRVIPLAVLEQCVNNSIWLQKELLLRLPKEYIRLFCQQFYPDNVSKCITKTKKSVRSVWLCVMFPHVLLADKHIILNHAVLSNNYKLARHICLRIGFDSEIDKHHHLTIKRKHFNFKLSCKLINALMKPPLNACHARKFLQLYINENPNSIQKMLVRNELLKRGVLDSKDCEELASHPKANQITRKLFGANVLNNDPLISLKALVQRKPSLVYMAIKMLLQYDKRCLYTNPFRETLYYLLTQIDVQDPLFVCVFPIL